jgi:hypothetical protein
MSEEMKLVIWGVSIGLACIIAEIGIYIYMGGW